MSDAVRILVVEDESIVAKDIRSSLQSLGYLVAGMASTGEEALAQAAALRPDLVLMDIKLKGEMDGIEAAHRLRSAGPVPVVYLTAYTDDDTLRRAKVSEAFGYLLKPFEDRELRTTIEMALYKHNMERKLRESREWFATTLRCIGDAVIATDISASVQFVNPQAENLTGWRQEDALGRPAQDIFCLQSADEQAPARIDVNALMDGSGDICGGKDVILLARDGRHTPVDYTAAPIRESDGRIMGVVIIFRDITEIKQAAVRERHLSERLSRSRRMESLGALAGGVAHDLNNILGPIVGYPDLIMKSLPPDSAIRADLEIIRNSARKALDVIRDLLTLGRTGKTPMRPVNLSRVVEASLKSMASMTAMEQAPLVELALNLAPDPGPVLGSEQHLQAMVANLVLHAYAMMPSGGRLQLSTAGERLSAPLDGYETVPVGDYAVLHAMDTGIGLSEDDLNRIFEPFYIKKRLNLQTGTGLGLAVVFGVVKEHNGYVNIRSTPGEGTDFTVYFPLAGMEAEPAAAPRQPAQDARGTETILLVDDDDEQRRFAARWLRSLGYQVLAASNGRAAVDLHTAALAGDKNVDLLVLDMIMADEMDGLDTYRLILEQNPRQRAIMVSGFAVNSRIKEALKLGAGQYLQKPYSLEELARLVRQELDRSDD